MQQYAWQLLVNLEVDPFWLTDISSLKMHMACHDIQQRLWTPDTVIIAGNAWSREVKILLQLPVYYRPLF